MYEIDDKDRVIELKDVPQSSVGAPCPFLLDGDCRTLLIYYLQNLPEEWDGKSPRPISSHTEGEPVAVVDIKRCYAHMFGPPNDESFSGHPLAKRGLDPYGVFEIENSSWIRKLEVMNSVHPYHDKKRFMENTRHFIFSFHDDTFECVAEGFTIEVYKGSIKGIVSQMLDSMR